MAPYLLRRLLLIPPTILGILLLNFVIIQAAPGGPIEQVMAQMGGMDSLGSTRIDSSGGEAVANRSGDDSASSYRGSRGVDARFIAELEKQFGFDSDEVRQTLGDVPLPEFEVVKWIREYIDEGLKEIFGGVLNEIIS